MRLTFFSTLIIETANIKQSYFLNVLGGNGNVVGTYRGEDYHVYLEDAQGSTTAVVKEDGTLSAAYTYSDFGETEEITGSSFDNEICYTGGVYDDTTGLYYLNARYYDPANGRFISQDTFRGTMDNPGQWHLYAYCANNPINYVDPSGHAKTNNSLNKGRFEQSKVIYTVAYQDLLDVYHGYVSNTASFALIDITMGAGITLLGIVVPKLALASAICGVAYSVISSCRKPRNSKFAEKCYNFWSTKKKGVTGKARQKLNKRTVYVTEKLHRIAVGRFERPNMWSMYDVSLTFTKPTGYKRATRRR